MALSDAERSKRYRDNRRQPVEPRVCPECGTEFTPKRRRDAITCSKRCRVARTRRKAGA